MYPDTNLNQTSARTRRSRAESRADTRAALLDAGAHVFVERGFQGASIEAITDAAGFTRGAFYSNFDSKEQFFAELLQERVFTRYRDMAQASIDQPLGLRATGEALAALQRDTDERWLFRLWLELLAHAGRDDDFRTLASGFWSRTRQLATESIVRAYERAGRAPPADPAGLASAMIALDIGLALQHFVDPKGVPLDVYPELFELLFSSPGEATGG
jgi:AcrR family transcriptional regulator